MLITVIKHAGSDEETRKMSSWEPILFSLNKIEFSLISTAFDQSMRVLNQNLYYKIE